MRFLTCVVVAACWLFVDCGESFANPPATSFQFQQSSSYQSSTVIRQQVVFRAPVYAPVCAPVSAPVYAPVCAPVALAPAYAPCGVGASFAFSQQRVFAPRVFVASRVNFRAKFAFRSGH